MPTPFASPVRALALTDTALSELSALLGAGPAGAPDFPPLLARDELTSRGLVWAPFPGRVALTPAGRLLAGVAVALSAPVYTTQEHTCPAVS